MRGAKPQYDQTVNKESGLYSLVSSCRIDSRYNGKDSVQCVFS